MMETCRAMVRDNNFCVLSTCRNNRTNSSLMLYLSEEDGTKLYMVTLKGSMKYCNMEENPEVSLLIDTREGVLGASEQVKALTVYGKSTMVKDPELGATLIQKLVERHPSLQSLAKMEEACVVQVDVESYLYLDGVNDAQHFKVRGE